MRFETEIYVTNTFAERLKQLRRSAGLSQRALGERMGVSRGAISYYENAERTPDIEMLYRISTFFGVSYDFLLGKTERMNKSLRSARNVRSDR